MGDIISSLLNLIGTVDDVLPIINSILSTKSNIKNNTKIPIEVRLASIKTPQGTHLAILIDLPNDNFEKAIVALLEAFGEKVVKLQCQ